MASQSTEEILKFVVQATGNESLTPIVRSILDLSGNSAEAEKAVGDLLTQLSDSQKLTATLDQYRKVGSSVLELSKQYDAAKLKVAELGKNLSDTDEPTKKQQAEFERARAALAKLGIQYDAQLTKLRGYKSELSAAGVSTSSFGAAQATLKARATEVTAALSGMAAAAKSTRAEQDALAAAQKELEKQLTVGERQAIRAAVAAEKLARATESVSNEQQAAAAKSSILGAAWTKLAAIGATLVGYLSINAAVQGVKNLLGLADASEKTRIRLAALYGSQEAGNKAFADLRALSQATGQEFAATAEAAARLKSFGIEPLNGSLQALIDQNARVGGSQETLNGLILAVGQAWAKQKLQGEEILQLVERGVPVWDLLAKATGKNTIELQKLSEAGKLGRTEIAALVREIGASAQGAAAQNLGTFGGLIVQLKDQWQQFLQAIADAGVLDYAKQQITALLDEGRRLAADGSIVRYAQATANALTSVASAIGGGVKLAYEYSGALIFVGKSLVALKFGQLLVDLGSFSARMKAAAVDSLAMAAASTTTTGKLGALATAARSIPTSIKLAITAVGVERAIENLIEIIELKGRLDSEDEKRRGALELSAKLEDEINAKITANLAEYAKFAGVAIKSQEELAAASRAQADEYRAALEGARAYYNTLEIQARRTNNALGLTEAREKLTQLEAALKSLTESLASVADANKKAAVGITEFAREMVRGFVDAQAAGTGAASELQGAFDKLDLTSSSGLNDAISAIKSIGNISKEAGEILEDELRARLAKLSNEDFAKVKKAAKEAFDEGSDGARRMAAAVNGINLTRLGVDISEIKTGFSDAGRDAVAAFEGAIREVEKLGLTSEQQSRAIAQAFDAAFSRVGTRPELEALREQLKAAFNGGKISAAEYERALAQLNARLDELAGKSSTAATNTRNVASAIREAKDAADAAGDSVDQLDSGIGNVANRSAEAAETVAVFTDAITAMDNAAQTADSSAFQGNRLFIQSVNRRIAANKELMAILDARIAQEKRLVAQADEAAQIEAQLILQYGDQGEKIKELARLLADKNKEVERSIALTDRETAALERNAQARGVAAGTLGTGSSAPAADGVTASVGGKGSTVELVLRNETNPNGVPMRLSADQATQIARTVLDLLRQDMISAGR